MSLRSCDVVDGFSRADVEAGAQRISYLHAGPDGAPVVVLLHGLASSADTWDRAIGALAQRGLRVLAPDLIGHGRSDKPRQAYTLEQFADSVHDFLDALDVSRVTLVGHSLGGAIAMAFGARHPQQLDRLVLVSAGGLGREVHPILRAAALPAAPHVLRLVVSPRLVRWYGLPRIHRAVGLTPDNVANLQRAGRALGTPDGRRSFFAALRAVIEPGGQRGSFIAMGLLSPRRPTLLVWNEHDPVIPVAHARAAHAHLPGSRLVLLPGRGHEPHRREAAAFADEVASFVLSSSSH